VQASRVNRTLLLELMHEDDVSGTQLLFAAVIHTFALCCSSRTITAYGLSHNSGDDALLHCR
jgi:hypothetical protein